MALLISTAANVARAPPRECPVTKKVAVGCADKMDFTAEITYPETAS